MMIRNRIRMVAILLASIFSSSALALPITFGYTSSLTSTGPGAALLPEFAGVFLPTTVGGSYQFDSNSPLGWSTPFGTKTYYQFLDAFEITIGGETFSAVAPNIGIMSFGNNATDGGSCCPGDGYGITTGANLENLAGSRIGVEFSFGESIDQRFYPGEIPDCITSSAFMIAPPDLTNCSVSNFRIFVGQDIAFQGKLSTLSLPVSGLPVPEPPILGLLVAGLLGFTFMRRKRTA
ncbi:MAG: PEP-CTERM sorting domain-containing protein [Gammaproteobacteria bacterium]